jgi:hypothetical protein
LPTYNYKQAGIHMQFRKALIVGAMALATLGAINTSNAGDVRMFVRHEVSDFAAWKKAFESFAPVQKKGGVFYKAVYQSADDPNDVTVIHDFHSLEKAKAFAANPELKSAMEKGGVKGAPQIWYTTRVGK